MDLLRIVVDLRRVAPTAATNAHHHQGHARARRRGRQADHGHRQGAARSRHRRRAARGRSHAAARVRAADRLARRPSTASTARSTINRDGLTLRDLLNLTQSDIFLTNLPGLFYRLLKTDQNTRTLANPQLRTSEGIPAQARFGERVPVPVTTFSPIATGGVAAAADHLVQLREHRREHRHHAAHAPRRSGDAGAQDRHQQHLGHRLRRAAHVRQSRDQHGDPAQGRRDQPAGRPDPRRRAPDARRRRRA